MASKERDPRTVFVVHGRNDTARRQMFDFLRTIGLQPLEWSEAVTMTGKAAPYIGEVLDTAFAAAQAVIVLFTPDEIAYLRSEYADDADPELNPSAQSRPNVLFEAGMATGRDSGRTVLVQLGDVRSFSDIAGKHVIRLDDSPARRKDLAQRLKTAGCDVNLSGEDWMRPDAFSTPPPPGGGLPLGRRVASNAPKRVRLDLRYHDRGTSSGRLEIVNTGTEDIYEVDLEVPAEAGNFHIMDQRELPLKRLPSGKSASIVAFRTLGGGRDHFDVRVTGRTVDGEPVSEDLFLSVVS